MRPVLLGLILTVSLAGADSWWDWLLRVTGISATARNLKGEPHELEGDIWVKSLATQTSVRYTWDGSYRSPIFIPNDGGILAIKAGKVVKISSSVVSTSFRYTLWVVASRLRNRNVRLRASCEWPPSRPTREFIAVAAFGRQLRESDALRSPTPRQSSNLGIRFLVDAFARPQHLVAT